MLAWLKKKMQNRRVAYCILRSELTARASQQTERMVELVRGLLTDRVDGRLGSESLGQRRKGATGSLLDLSNAMPEGVPMNSFT